MNVDLETLSYVRQHALDQLLGEHLDARTLETNSSGRGINAAVDPTVSEPYPIHWNDLVRLHRLVVERKVTTILEFGVGKSTPILAHALRLNQEAHGDFVSKNLRRNNAFELHSVDDMEKYIEIARSLVPSQLIELCHFHFSRVVTGTFNDRYCTYYEKLPNICPDFIYLDAPSQTHTLGEVRGFSTNHKDRLPMAADILSFEHFLLPGTLILVDGRTANARFLKCNLQRDWSYRHDSEGDLHFFELREEPLGKYNRAQIEFCLGREWLSGIA